MLEEAEVQLLATELVRSGEVPIEDAGRIAAAVSEAMVVLGMAVVPVGSPITDAEVDKALLETWADVPEPMRRARIRAQRYQRMKEHGAPQVILDHERALAFDAIVELGDFVINEMKRLQREGPINQRIGEGD